MHAESGSLKKAFGDNNPLKGYYLVRSYASDSGAYESVCELPLEEAIAKCAEQEPNRGLDDERNPAEYMHHRLETEDWLRSKAEESAVRIDRHHPVYFAFTNDLKTVKDRMMEMRPDNTVIDIPAEKLDLSNWSFTMDDHFFADHVGGDGSNLEDFEQHPLHGRVMSATDLVDAIAAHGYPQDETKHNIEAQMWSSEPIMDVPNVTPNVTPAAKPQQKI